MSPKVGNPDSYRDRKTNFQSVTSKIEISVIGDIISISRKRPLS